LEWKHILCYKWFILYNYKHNQYWTIWFIINFVVQSHNESNQKSQTLKNENFIKASHSMMMIEFKYHDLIG